MRQTLRNDNSVFHVVDLMPRATPTGTSIQYCRRLHDLSIPLSSLLSKKKRQKTLCDFSLLVLLMY